MLAFILIFFAFTVSVALYFKLALSYWKRRNVPHPPTSFPFGNVKNIITQKVSYGEEISKVYKEFKSRGERYFGYYFLTKPILVLTDLELIKDVMTKDFRHFTDHNMYSNEEVDPLTGNLFNAKGLKWKNLRTRFNPTFTSAKIKMMFPIIASCSGELLNLIEKYANNSKPLDAKDVAQRFTMDVISSCAFGCNCNSLVDPDSEFRRHAYKVFNPTKFQVVKDFISISFPEVLHFFKIRLFAKDTSDFFINLINQTIRHREDNNIIRKDFVHLLIQLKNDVTNQTENGMTLTLNDLAAQTYVFYAAGFETSSTTLTFCLYELATNLKIQEKVREEIYNVLEKHNSEITYETLTEMSYMERCIKETLRKYPALPIGDRVCTQTYKIPNSNLVVEKGTQVFLPIYAIQRDPDYYSDPLQFDPDRFLPENVAKRHSLSWLPFGEGPRVCIGQKFGMVEMKLALTMLLKEYCFTVNKKTVEPLKIINPKGIMTCPIGEVWLNVKKVN